MDAPLLHGVGGFRPKGGGQVEFFPAHRAQFVRAGEQQRHEANVGFDGRVQRGRAFEGQQDAANVVRGDDVAHRFAGFLRQDVLQVGGRTGFPDFQLHGIGADAADDVEAIVRRAVGTSPVNALNQFYDLHGA